MTVKPPTVAEVAVYGPESPEFEAGIKSILGRGPRDLLKPALPYSVIAENRARRGIALLGLRFDMVGPRGKNYSVTHYSDTLRNPLKGDFLPGALRFVCAEPEYTALVRSGGVVPHTRGRMNLDNLRLMLSMSVSVDCVALEDGQFMGPDSQGAFRRLAEERVTESEVVAEAIARRHEPVAAIENWLTAAVQDDRVRARRTLARKLLEGLEAGGASEMAARAQAHRLRLELRRIDTPHVAGAQV